MIVMLFHMIMKECCKSGVIIHMSQKANVDTSTDN